MAIQDRRIPSLQYCYKKLYN